jgi:hypothetical protein
MNRSTIVYSDRNGQRRNFSVDQDAAGVLRTPKGHIIEIIEKSGPSGLQKNVFITPTSGPTKGVRGWYGRFIERVQDGMTLDRAPVKAGPVELPSAPAPVVTSAPPVTNHSSAGKAVLIALACLIVYGMVK